MRALEDRTGNEEHFYAAPAARVLKENNYWVACKALIKEVRVAPRKEVLLLRALAIKGRAKTSDPILNFVNGLPDGVAWNVLSFWQCYYRIRTPNSSGCGGPDDTHWHTGPW